MKKTGIPVISGLTECPTEPVWNASNQQTFESPIRARYIDLYAGATGKHSTWVCPIRSHATHLSSGLNYFNDSDFSECGNCVPIVRCSPRSVSLWQQKLPNSLWNIQHSYSGLLGYDTVWSGRWPISIYHTHFRHFQFVSAAECLNTIFIQTPLVTFYNISGQIWRDHIGLSWAGLDFSETWFYRRSHCTRS
jgi:hypothetical protein